jgi:predicted transcriptional regulator
VRNEGTWLGTIEKRIRQTQHVPVRYTEEGHGTYATTERWEGLYKTAENVYTSRTSTVSNPEAGLVAVTGIPFVTPIAHIAPGIIRRVTETENEDCTSNIVVENRYSEAVDPAVDGEAHTKFEDTDTSGKRNAVAPEAGAPVSGGKITEVSSQKNEFGLWDTRKTERTGVAADDAVMVKQIDAFGVVDSDTDRNKTTAIAEETTQTPGRIKQTRAQLNDYGLYDNTEEVRTSTSQTDFAESASHNAFDKEATAQSRNLVAEPVLPTAQTPGQVKRLMKRLNEFLRWDSEETTQTAEVQAAAGASKTVQKFVVEANAEARNLVAEPVLEDTQTPGIIKTIQKRLNLFLRWDKQEQTRTAVEVDDAQKSKQISKFETVVSDTDRNKAGAITEETTQTAGKIKQTRNTVNDFGLNDHETQERTAAEVDDAQKTKQITAFETVVSDVDRNKAAAVVEETTQTPGQIKQTRNTVNDFALNDHETQVRTATEVDGVIAGGQKTAAETATITGDRNKAAAATLGALVPGQIEEARSTFNEFQKWDTQKTTRVAIDQTGTGHTDTHAEDVTETRHTQAAAELAAPVAPVGQIKEVQSQPTDFGKWQTTERTRTAEDQASTDQSAGHRSTAEVTKHTHKVAQEVAGTPAAGQQISVSNRPTPFGDFETAKQVDTAVELTGTDYDRNGLSGTDINKTWSGNKLVGAPVRGAGTAVTRVQLPTPFKDKWDITEATETGTPWDTGWLAFDSASGTRSFRAWGNQPESFHLGIVAAFTQSTNNSISTEYNKYGFWNGSAAKTNADGSGGSFWRSTVEVDSIKRQLRRIEHLGLVSKEKYQKDQYRDVTISYRSVVTQTFGEADTSKRIFMALSTSAKTLVGEVSINKITDGGRTGWLVEAYYTNDPAWLDVGGLA